ncbi:hypothetical protein FRC01_005865 [Tulasnella sp. 417]|nr:hypothetical protein FRC01_005865 [Tulasnella sp. 417]
MTEAGFLVELSHENVVALQGFVEDVSEGIVWLVFPWESNGNLRDFVASRDWEIPERIWLIDDVAQGLEYLHTQSPPICHGDLKSVNILVNSKCCALITDFGSARRLAEADLDAETEQVGNERHPAPRLEATFCASTNTITLTGNEYTLRWAAPELLKDEPLTVMTNAIPFEDVAKESIVIKRVTQGHLPSIIGDARMSLMLQLCWLMSQCWSADPSQRPTATDCRKSLDWMGKVEEAIALYSEALEISTSIDDMKLKADVLWGLAQMHTLQKKYSQAVTFYSNALKIHTEISDINGKADALLGLADVHRLQGEYSQAATVYSDALRSFADIGDQQGKASAMWGLAKVYRFQRDYNQAITFFSDALKICTDIGDTRGRGFALAGVADVKCAQGHHHDAIDHYEQAAKIFQQIGHADMIAQISEDAAEARRLAGLEEA